MKRLKFKITRGLKSAMVVSALLGAVLFSTLHSKNAGDTLKHLASTSFAFVGVAGALKSKGKWDALDDNTKAFIELQDEQLKALSEGKLEVKELEAKMKEYLDKNPTSLSEAEQKELDELKESVKKQAQLLDQLKNRASSADPTGVIAKALADNEPKIKEFLSSGKKGKLEIEVKAAQTAADIATHTIGDYAPGIGQIPVRKPFIEDIFPSVNTTKEFIKYMDQESVVRDAKNVAGCAASAHNTKLTWKERNIQMTKVRDYIDVCQDMMDDYDFVEGEIRNLIESSVQLKVDNGLLMDDAAYPNLNSIDNAASTFDPANTLDGTIEAWTGKVQDANFYDLIIAMASQIIALGQDNAYIPDTVLINTIDKYKNMLIKDKNGQYLLPPFVAVVDNKEYTIDNMKVRSNPIVPVNTLYMFDSSKGTLYKRRGITIELSYENNDNFETETVTVKAYRRMNLLIRNVNKNAFMKCTDITAALVAIDSAA